MEEETSFVVYEGVVVPESVLLERERGNKYGSVPGLDDDELADPGELERQVHREEFEPVLVLPVKGKRGSIQAAVDESGGVDWGAFGTVDFERSKPRFDKAKYKADKLREELGNVLIMISIVKRRLPRAKYKVLRYIRMGVIGLEHITNEDMHVLATLELRARRIRAEIADLDEFRAERRKAAVARVFT